MISAICRELTLSSQWLNGVALDSIYFGGGTPSILSNDELAAITGHIYQNFKISPNAEVTLEANPDDINLYSLKAWLNLGINRLSIGLQSFDERELQWMNRAHSAAESVSAVKLSQDAGFENLSIDLIYGSKFQTLSSWEKTLEKAVELNTRHISSYNLTIENKTVLGIKNARGQEPAVNDELSSAQFILLSDFLQSHGFSHYEVSNFAKSDFIAVHNSNYWKGVSYLGIGPSAHSFNGKQRKWNVSNNSVYIKSILENSSWFTL
jgi:oxygen-independent coproporphyrinogen III oxidase